MHPRYKGDETNAEQSAVRNTFGSCKAIGVPPPLEMTSLLAGLNLYRPRSLLSLADAKDLGAALRAGALGSRTTVFESDLLWALDLSLSPTLEAICFHEFTSIGYK